MYIPYLPNDQQYYHYLLINLNFVMFNYTQIKHEQKVYASGAFAFYIDHRVFSIIHTRISIVCVK